MKFDCIYGRKNLVYAKTDTNTNEALLIDVSSHYFAFSDLAHEISNS